MPSVCGVWLCPCCLALSLQAVEKLLAVLDTLDRWIEETPPVDQPSRFGNKAFRSWYARLDQVSCSSRRGTAHGPADGPLASGSQAAPEQPKISCEGSTSAP